MPAAAKEALIEIGSSSRSRRPAANGKASPAKAGASPAADAKSSELKGAPAPADAAWSEGQELALVQASGRCFLGVGFLLFIWEPL